MCTVFVLLNHLFGTDKIQYWFLWWRHTFIWHFSFFTSDFVNHTLKVFFPSAEFFTSFINLMIVWGARSQIWTCHVESFSMFFFFKHPSFIVPTQFMRLDRHNETLWHHSCGTEINNVRKFENARVRNFYAYKSFSDYSSLWRRKKEVRRRRERKRKR